MSLRSEPIGIEESEILHRRGLAAINKSVALTDDRGRVMRFPARTDYLRHFIDVGILKSEEELAYRDDLAKSIYMDWLKTGQVGCVFAQYFARDVNRIGMRTHVVTGVFAQSSAAAMASEIFEVTRQSISDIEIESLSVLIPGISDVSDLTQLLLELLRDSQWSLEFERRWRSLTILGIRVALSDVVRAEVLGMGPFLELPPTRQCPIVSLEIRTNTARSKRGRLDPSQLAAHLADLPTTHFLTPERHGRMFTEWTPKLKARILGGEEDIRAKASATFSIPTAMWESVKS